MQVDMHMHSSASDGALAPAALVALCAQERVRLMSLTDHDTMAGVPEAARAAEAHGVGLVPGAEISTLWAGQTIHVVGLGLDPASTGVAQFFADVSEKRERRGREMAAAFERLGIPGAYEGAVALAGGTTENLSRTHFALWLLQNGFIRNYQEAFDKYLSRGRPCSVDVAWPSVPAAVDFICAEGGIAVLAHPGRYKYESAWAEAALLDAFKQAGGRAIEVTSGSQGERANVHFAEAARQMGFLASTGSHWHSERSKRPLPGGQPALPNDLTPVWTALGFDARIE